MKPPPKLTVSQWADSTRQLPVGSPFPGKWRSDRAEYQRGIMDAFSNPEVERIVVMTSAQVGKTEILNNIVGYFVEHDPNGPLMVIQPSLEMARAWSTDRLTPLISSTPQLKDLISDPKAKEGDNSILQKIFYNGARITISGSNSPASLASRPIRIMLMDEVDRFPPSAGAEGDVVALASRRTQNYFNRKIALFSTPTVKNESRIEAAFEQSDQRVWELPCRCGHFQALKWRHVKWEDKKPETACIECEKCGHEWTDIERKQAIKKGRWHSNAEFNGTAGFSLNALSSPWTSLEGLVREFLEAKAHGTESLRVFINTALGESWAEDSEEIKSSEIIERREHYTHPVPDGVLVLTSAVDVQKDRIECLVCGHGHLSEMWFLDHKIYYGDPANDAVWNDLADYLRVEWRLVNSKSIGISQTLVDSGYETQRVYQFIKRMGGHRVHASKGVGGAGRPAVGRASKSNSARVPVMPIGVNTLKETLFARLRNVDFGPGYWHIPDFFDQEWCYQLTAEKAVKRFSKGIPRIEYIKMRPRNEALDLAVLNLAAFAMLNVNTEKIQQRLEEVRKPEKTTPLPRYMKPKPSWAKRFK